jgi:putative transposase
VAQRTLQRWIAAYRAAGLDGLRPRPRGDRGQHRLPAELCQLIEGLALVRPRASIATITRRAGGAAQVNGWKQPSYSVVRRIVTGLDPALATLALDGPVAYRDRFELVWRRAADRPNEQWQADHTELDILVTDPGGRLARPWLTVVMDDHSRAVCGYYVFLGAPSAMNTGLACGRRSGTSPTRTGRCAGSPTSCMSTTAATSSATSCAPRRWTCAFG